MLAWRGRSDTPVDNEEKAQFSLGEWNYRNPATKSDADAGGMMLWVHIRS